MNISLKDKIALVTGGSRGIGAAIVAELVGAGATVIFTYSQSAQQAEAVVQQHGGKAQAIKADANQPETMAALIAQIKQQYGRLDILVNNAGVFTLGMVGELSLADYQRCMRINVDSVFALCNEAVKIMPAGGRIVNISSGLGERATGAGMSAYVASKFAVCGLTRAFAKDLGSKAITVNAVLPGPIDTEMNPANGPAADFQKSQVAIGRYGTAAEVAASVLFLASPAASNITGATLAVDGGWNA